MIDSNAKKVFHLELQIKMFHRKINVGHRGP